MPEDNPAKIHDVIAEDLEFGRADDVPLIARLYRPRDVTGFPAIVEVHGGAWTGGDRFNNVVMHNAISRKAGMGWNGCSKPRRIVPTGHFLRKLHMFRGMKV